ncbi:MAG: Gfo/Idh/MocA family oxidoreductase [Prevotella sp.]|jgi:predicted dehydrogenase|nr:Gfo/Idh/MocA family oxidoreductase [Prevotella sp.]MCI2080048.1 Gfo/Idh/MocA family oxidoreductase [Prevotella sp.]MCI2101839.1 Gfo/Idh/MocA family oxidoreductase [Prevotella sp.]
MMNKKLLSLSLVAMLFILPQSMKAQFNWPYKIVNGTAVTEVPARPAGQKDALNLVTPKLDVVRVGFVGLGMRGPGAVERWTHIPGTQIMALCDHEKDRAERCENILRKADMPKADIYYGEDGYKQLCERKDIDLVYIATDWLHHVPVAKYALEHGKHVAIEVPSAMNLHEIWDLINLAESKQLHCMILENCCYDFFELNTLNMAQKGLFGEILYVTGAYRHTLSPFWDAYWKKDANDKLGWRLDYNKKFRGDIYATHGLGPVAQLLNIHRGDRMKTLVAMDTKSVNGKAKVEQVTGEPCDTFRNGDATTTLISTVGGKVIEIHHNVMDPQPYNRMYQLTGTKGFANKYPVEGYALTSNDMKSAGITPSADDLQGHDYISASDKAALEKKFQSPIITKYGEEAKEVGGHGGMDFIEDSRLVYCLRNGLPLDMDVYDLAEWCCLAELGSISMDNGNIPVQVPDFTRGLWNKDKGFRHAFASPEQEAATEASGKAFTAKLKEQGKKYWDKVAKQEAKAAKKAQKAKK